LSLKINSGIEEELPHYQFLFSDFILVFIRWTRIKKIWVH